MLGSVWRVAITDKLAVHVDWLLSEGSAHADRRALAEHLPERMVEGLPS